MKFKITRISKDEWHEHLCRDAFNVSFGNVRHPNIERIDFALIATDSFNTISGFVTCKEMDAETLYWQYGGAMPNHSGTINVWNGYRCFIDWAKEKYKRVNTRIENRNYSMLRMAMKAGFCIVGTFNFNGKIYLDLAMEV